MEQLLGQSDAPGAILAAMRKVQDATAAAASATGMCLLRPAPALVRSTYDPNRVAVPPYICGAHTGCLVQMTSSPPFRMLSSRVNGRLESALGTALY